MVWKSNLDENEQEFIEDFGAKAGQDTNTGGVPSVNTKPRPAPKRNNTSRLGGTAAKGRQPSP